jgi:NADPH:quinone reductase
MKALFVDGPQAPFRLAAIESPEPALGEVLIRTQASGVNPLDTKIRGGGADHARHPLPAVLGLDVAGVVEAVGAGVRGFAVGDAVFGMVGGVGGHPGTLAELVAVDARLLALTPQHLSPREAAALPLVAITAWEGLVDRAGVRAGQRVLIHGGAGGVGHVAIQIARARGASVFATGSSAQQDVISRLGGTFIDYAAEMVGDYVARHTEGAGFDVVYDTVGGPVLDASFQAVRRFGHVVSCLGWGTHSLAPLSFRAATYSGVFTLLPLLTGEGREHHGEILREVARLGVRPLVDPRRFGLDSVEEAYRAVVSGSAVGKIVVDMIE